MTDTNAIVTAGQRYTFVGNPALGHRPSLNEAKIVIHEVCDINGVVMVTYDKPQARHFCTLAYFKQQLVAGVVVPAEAPR